MMKSVTLTRDNNVSNAMAFAMNFTTSGVPTTEARANERYSARFKMYTSDSECGLARLQWHRFLRRTVPFLH
jgi:hypothetical protein